MTCVARETVSVTRRRFAKPRDFGASVKISRIVHPSPGALSCGELRRRGANATNDRARFYPGFVQDASRIAPSARRTRVLTSLLKVRKYADHCRRGSNGPATSLTTMSASHNTAAGTL